MENPFRGGGGGGGMDIFWNHTFNIVLWVEGPSFVHLCGIFQTKLCDSRLISMIHSTLCPSNCLQNARNDV